MKSAAPERATDTVTDYGTFGADFRFMPVEDIADPALQRLLAFWNDARGEKKMPPRSVMSPRALAPWLRNIQTFEVIHGGLDFRCGVCGAGLAEATAMHMTGKFLSEFENVRLRDRMMSSMRRVIDTQTPVHMVGEQAAHAHLVHKRVETLWLPFGGESGPTHILAGVLFTPRAATAA